MKVYLSGGMHSGWQNVVKSYGDSRITFIDPRDHGLLESARYTVWDLAAVKVCDVVLAYLEADNPSGFGLSLEVGAAYGFGKIILLVDEKYNQYTAIIRDTVTLEFNNLLDAVAYMNSLVQIYG